MLPKTRNRLFKSFSYGLALLLISSSLFGSEGVESLQSEENAPVALGETVGFSSFFKSSSSKENPTESSGYTINYNTVSIIEYIRFASKVCNINFIFDATELDFTVTVVSDAPITPQNVMGTLVQVLRIHGFFLLEQDNNLVIHKTAGVMQLATIVTSDKQAANAPIVTRIFRVKEAKVDAVAGVVRPMISSSALLEVLPETKQMILTDATVNVEKVAALIEILDSPVNQMAVKTYAVQNNSPEHLVDLATQIMGPIAQGHPFLLVPQPLTGAIFIVSNNDLVEKTVSVLTNLDVPPKKELLNQRKLKGENIFVYKAIERPSDEIVTGLFRIASTLQKSGIPEGDLIQTIESARAIKETNSITFIGSKESIAKVKEFIAALDVAGKEAPSIKSSFFVYRPKFKSASELEASLKELADNLKGAKEIDPALALMLNNAKINKTTNTLLFSGDESQFNRIKELIASIDTQQEKVSKSEKNDFFIYKIQQATYDEIHSSLKSFAKNLDKSNVHDEGLIAAIDQMKSLPETRSILFPGSEPALKRLKELVPSFDLGMTTIPPSNQFFIYKPKNQRGELLSKTLQEVTHDLKSDQFQDPALLRTIESVKYIKTTDSLLFTGDAGSIKRLEDLLATIDLPSAQKAADKILWLYHPKYVSKEKTESYLRQLSASLDKETETHLVDTFRSAKWIDASQSFLFQGTQQAIQRVQEILQNFDQISQTPAKNFFLYPLKNASAQKTGEYLNELAESLAKKEGASEDIVETLRSRKWIADSHSFMFQGSETSLARIKEMLQAFDIPEERKTSFFLYEPKYASSEKTAHYLDQLAVNLPKVGQDQELVEAIHTKKWIEESHSFMFQGPVAVLDRIKQILTDFDKPEAKSIKPGYFLYKLQSASGDVIEEELETLAKNLKAGGMKEEKTLSVIENMRYVKETNSLLLTGDPAAIEEVKKMIAEYDYPRTSPSQASSNFFLYKPQHQSASQIEKALHDVAANLKKGGLADASLLHAIDGAKYVETTNSLIFTGSADAIQKIQSLLKEIDTPPKEHAQIQHVGKTTFLLYKLKAAGGKQIMTSIQTMAADLKKSDTADADMIQALGSMKYVKETNSLFFTGTEEALKKVQSLVEQFDVSSLAATSASTALQAPAHSQNNFYLYKPTSLSAADLEKLMHDFAENLRSSGLSDPDLFAAINSMRQVEKTQSLVFTGTPKALDQIKELLKSFDHPSNLTTKTLSPSLEPSIQPIDNTSFLVYKLQFHKGDEIQNALKQIAKDLIGSNAPINQNLLNSINSIQWLDVTNSLLCSGDQETLTRLKELIKNLDIPLKQVFIEILVIETTLSNALLFGLEWGGNFKFLDRFGISSFNTVPPPNAQATFPDQFISKLSGLTPPGQPPTPIGNIPPVAGFDLGVIGEVIKHNGNTFLTIGSLLNALQSDNQTSIITAPKILGQDGRTSTIFSGANIPFTGSFVNNTTSGATILTSNIEYRDIGLNLTITPVLGNSDIVTLDIQLDRSQTATDITGQAQLNFQSQTANGIVTSKTTMETTVHVPDRNFLILSGFVNNSTTKVKQGIPCLGGLPMIGAAFSQQNDTISSQNVVIFLRPFIINSIEDMRKVTSEQEAFFRDLATTPFLEHHFDDAVELIKSIDDD